MWNRHPSSLAAKKDPANLYYEAMKPGGSSGLRPNKTSAQDMDLSDEIAPAFC
jgi:hypothetical protein